MIIDKNSDKLNKILNRGELFDEKYLSIVMDILKDVRINGDKAVKSYTKKFDNHDLNESYVIGVDELKSSFDKLESGLKNSLIKAEKSIRFYHEKQMEKTWLINGNNGIILGQKISPVENVGIYVPGGKAVYPSSVLMNSVPANVAGVENIVMSTPAAHGKIQESVLAAAYLGGVKKVYKIGGAQAVAAMAYGTETVEKVDKIVGPGNIFVALAKKLVFGFVDIDMIAGPSEITIIADESARPQFVAADMLSQAEHDEMASSVLITDSKALAESVNAELKKQLGELPRKDIAEASLKDFGAIVLVENLEEAAEVSDKIAPEHLELCVANPYELMFKVRNAGAIFLGHYTPEAVGDYIAGPNHTLPTGGSARFFSPLGAYDFLKRSSIVNFSKDALRECAEDVMGIANSEELTAHAKSVKVRI
ncbi:histidinol dehydrogenase [Flexistipes sp.]|uniref:histidinol dehydrogenase n=1 Tax=Flexistipes sp. TaxID=3088135 RepID=UPI002E1B42AA|nr:histidinol dehydrogenase [Flexistipes sp.]